MVRMSKDSIKRKGIKSRSEPWRIPIFKGQAEESIRLRKSKKQKANHKSSFTEIKEGDSIERGLSNKDMFGERCKERKAPTGFATWEAVDEGMRGLGDNSVKERYFRMERLGGGK